MIKFYAYYNYGGYKDFYLGTISDVDEYKYFLPLLNVYEQTLKDKQDDELYARVKHQRDLPKIIALSDFTEQYNYPDAAKIMMSHSGYKILYKKVDSAHYVLAIRDISGSADNYGRRTPFNVMMIGDKGEDKTQLDYIAEYARQNLMDFETFLNTLFENDFEENGLKVRMKELNTKINHIISNRMELPDYYMQNKDVPLIVLSRGMRLASAVKEQNISKHDIAVCYNVDGELLYKAIHQQDSNNEAECISINVGPVKKTERMSGYDEYPNPSLHKMFNVPKIEDIQKLWDYIHKLEKRIMDLENKQ